MATPKQLANKMKAKGLQKLRWYCEMCQKQCRDENGFKCHCMSESHQRQMAIFAQNPHKVMDDYTKEFEKVFLELLSRRFGTRRVAANIVYNEYISDKTHTHMNATSFETLTTFVKYLGRTGKCVIDETEKGWYIQYIDRDPIVLARQEALERSKKKELDDQQRHEKLLDRLVKQAKETGVAVDDQKFTGLERREGEDEPVKFELGGFGKKRAVTGGASAGPVPISVAFGASADDDELKRVLATAPKPKEFKVPEFMQSYGSNSEDALPAAASRPKDPHPEPPVSAAPTGDNWIAKGIIVKIMNNKVGGGKYYEAKGTILKLESKYIALVRISGTKEALRIDQNDLETVIPALGGPVMIVVGKHKGKKGVLYSVSPEKYQVAVKLDDGDAIVEELEYEHVCKLDEEYEAKLRAKGDGDGGDKKRKRKE